MSFNSLCLRSRFCRSSSSFPTKKKKNDAVPAQCFLCISKFTQCGGCELSSLHFLASPSSLLFISRDSSDHSVGGPFDDVNRRLYFLIRNQPMTLVEDKKKFHNSVKRSSNIFIGFYVASTTGPSSRILCMFKVK